jgi:phospholipase D1/2
VEPFEPWEREEMEKLLAEVNGHLGQSHQQSVSPLLIFLSQKVLYPTKFLEAEDDADNFLFNADR